MATSLPEPTTAHGPPTRHCVLDPCHDGQIQTPVVRAWHKGNGYLVQLAIFDASDRTYGTPEEFSGDFWACTAWLQKHDIFADIDAA